MLSWRRLWHAPLQTVRWSRSRDFNTLRGERIAAMLFVFSFWRKRFLQKEKDVEKKGEIHSPKGENLSPKGERFSPFGEWISPFFSTSFSFWRKRFLQKEKTNSIAAIRSPRKVLKSRDRLQRTVWRGACHRRRQDNMSGCECNPDAKRERDYAKPKAKGAAIET